jgi:hypothetical protein
MKSIDKPSEEYFHNSEVFLEIFDVLPIQSRCSLFLFLGFHICLLKKENKDKMLI